ncbi:uncharacterized protein LOC117298864 [Asterias rubens]|uniref:uncharacterized protein LOC117298864 n=1 Tax=Asterias rubens TaxID=7604 RepID=UPI001455107E|nr:uncharacterized protein LOC117298864 [Asterias rubens]
MASSYINGNVEACYVPEDTATGEKTTNGHVEDSKHTQASRLQISYTSLLLHVVSFTAVIWLIVQVVQLRYDLARLHNENTRMGGIDWRDDQHKPTQQAEDEIIQDSNVNLNTRQRSRRQAQVGGSSDTYSYDYDTLLSDGLPSLHVVGNQQDYLEQSTVNWFTFHTSSDTGMLGRISHESLVFVHNQFIEIKLPGHYFVYSQITYAGRGGNFIGHEVVVRPDCGDGNEFAILESRALQVTPNAGQTPSGDSGYGGGVFYLAANDRVGVRPLQGGSHYFTKDNGPGSYFGAFLLSKSSSMDVDPDLRRCP